MGGNIVTAIANGSAPYLANEVKNQIQGNSVESDIQRTLAHGLVNAGLALAKGENTAAQAAGAMTGETMGILSHSLYGKTPEELTETEKQNISAWATLASGIVGGLISDNSAGVANAAQAGKVVVENNFLSPDDRDVRDKALEDQKADRNLKEASQNIIYLSDKDAYTDRLVDLYLKGELDSKGQIALAEYLDAVGIQLQLRGLSESDTKIQIENILKYPARFKDTRSAYYDALGYLSTEERHAWQAMIGTDALLAGPGRTSQLMRLALISGGSYQTGTGLAQIADGKIAEGSINVGLGGLAVSGGYLGNKVTGKSNGGVVSPENHVWQENTLVKYPFYDKPQQGGTLNIGAGNKPIEGAYNISHPDYPKGTGVYAGDVNNLSNIATGSQKTIIMENPYGFKPFHDEVLRVLDKNGIIVVKGSWNNPVIKKIENEAKKHGFVLTEKNVIPSAGFSQTDGKPINNLTITEYKFKKGDDK